VTEQELFTCEPLQARLSGRQCLMNVGRAQTLKLVHRALGAMIHCLTCERWQTIRVGLPSDEAIGKL
jgi:hypothetical protein